MPRIPAPLSASLSVNRIKWARNILSVYGGDMTANNIAVMIQIRARVRGG